MRPPSVFAVNIASAVRWVMPRPLKKWVENAWFLPLDRESFFGSLSAQDRRAMPPWPLRALEACGKIFKLRTRKLLHRPCDLIEDKLRENDNRVVVDAHRNESLTAATKAAANLTAAGHRLTAPIAYCYVHAFRLSTGGTQLAAGLGSPTVISLTVSAGCRKTHFRRSSTPFRTPLDSVVFSGFDRTWRSF